MVISALVAVGWFEKFLTHLQKGVDLRTCFSGCDTPSHALWQLQQECLHRGVDVQAGMHNSYACDSWAAAREVLLQLPVGQRPQCVFEDIKDRYSLSVWSCLLEHRHKSMMSAAAAGVSSKRELGIQFLADAVQVLLEQPLAKSATSHCAAHNQKCPIFKEGNPERLVIHMAGPTCVDLSSMNIKKAEMSGKHSLPMAAWLGDRGLQREPIIVIENVPGMVAYLDEVRSFLCKATAASYKYEHLITSPLELGFPASRTRMYALFWDPARVSFNGESWTEALTPWHCSPCLDGEAFFWEQNVRKETVSLSLAEDMRLKAGEELARSESQVRKQARLHQKGTRRSSMLASRHPGTELRIICLAWPLGRQRQSCPYGGVSVGLDPSPRPGGSLQLQAGQCPMPWKLRVSHALGCSLMFAL